MLFHFILSKNVGVVSKCIVGLFGGKFGPSFLSNLVIANGQ